MPAFAAEGGASDGLEEILITAQKREENMQKVGISVTAITEKMLESYNMSSVGDLGAQMPSVRLDSDGVTGKGISLGIRGIRLGDFNDATEAPVALYVDEFYILPVSAGSFLLFDIDRVEALRGPQGTLFGRNANGGLLHLVTKKPKFDVFEGEVEVEGGEFGTFNQMAVLNVPVSENLALRFGVDHDYNRGWVNNTTGKQPDGGANDFTASRAQLQWRASDIIDVNLKFERNDADAAFGSYQGIFTDTDANGNTTYEPDPDPNSHAWNGPFRTKNLADMYTGRVNVELNDSTTLTSITGYLDLYRRLDEDCDGMDTDICRAQYRFDTTQFTQEFRLGYTGDRSRFFTGLYYLKQDGKGNPIASVFGATEGFTIETTYDIEVEGKAIYGQVEYDITDDVTIIGGVRYSQDKKYFEETVIVGFPGTITGPDEILDFSGSTPFTDAAAGLASLNFTPRDITLLIDPLTGAGELGVLPGVDPALLKRDDKLVNARLQANWRVTDDTLLYGSFNRGARSGNYNNGYILGIPPEGIPVGSDLVYAYELGVKTQSDRFRVNGALFYNDYKKYQNSTFDNLGLRTGIIKASFSGGEVEALWNVADGLDIGLNYSYVYADLEGRPGNSRSPNTYSGMVNYSRQVGKGEFSANVNFLYVDKEPSADGAVFDSPAYEKINMRLGYEINNLEFFVWGRNLTDDQPVNYNFPLLGILSQQEKRPPRWFGAGMNYSF